MHRQGKIERLKVSKPILTWNEVSARYKKDIIELS